MTAKRYPMQLRAPPRNVRMLPQAPGVLEILAGGLIHRSGLVAMTRISSCSRVYTAASSGTHLNSAASAPHSDFMRLTNAICTIIMSPFVALQRERKHRVETLVRPLLT